VDEAVDDIRVIIDWYGDGLVGMVAKMRLLSSRVLKGRIDIVFYVVVVDLKKEGVNRRCQIISMGKVQTPLAFPRKFWLRIQSTSFCLQILSTTSSLKSRARRWEMDIDIDMIIFQQ
jgi:hypothetical protein